MSNIQKQAGAAIAVLVLVATTVFALHLAILVSRGSFAVDPLNTQSSLLFPWRFATSIIELGTAVNVVFAGLIAVVTAGTAWITEVYAKCWQLIAIVILCLIGSLSSIYLIAMVGSEEIAQLKYFGATEVSRQSVIAFCAELIALFSLFLTSRLGIAAASPNGPLRTLLKKLYGEGASG